MHMGTTIDILHIKLNNYVLNINPKLCFKNTNSKMFEMQNATTTQYLKSIKAPKLGTYGYHNNLATFP